jgi:Tol biopolymer transport system component
MAGCGEQEDQVAKQQDQAAKKAAEETTILETTATAPTTTAAPTAATTILVTDDLAYYPPESRRVFAFSPKGDKVAFLRKPAATGSLYVINSDGTDLTRLTDEDAPYPPDQPILSPDRSKIAFWQYVPKKHPKSNAPGYQTDIYVVKSDGTGLTNVTDSDSMNEMSPTFSPSGEKIAFDGGGPKTKGSEIYVSDPGGKNQSKLTDSTGNDLTPTFSPSGDKIAFKSNRDGMVNFEIYAMNADGSNQKRLTNDKSWDDQLAFSPDGEKVAFQRTNVKGSVCSADVYVVDVDGAGLTRLTHRPCYNGQPTFIPGTDRVAFVSYRDGDADIYTIRLDGTGLSNLTDTDSVNETKPSFSADGTKMAYASGRPNDSGSLVSKIYVMELDYGD